MSRAGEAKSLDEKQASRQEPSSNDVVVSELEHYMTSISLNDFQAEGIDLFRWERKGLVEHLYSHRIEANTPEFMIIAIHCTAYRRITITLNLLDGYPASSSLHLEVKSKLLPKKLVDRLKNKCVEEVIEPLRKEGKPQAIKAYLFLHNVIMNNKLLYATPEIGQLKKIIGQSEKAATGEEKKGKTCSLSCNDSLGVIKMKIVNGDYSLRVVITVPVDYPRDPIDIQFGSSTFPHQVLILYYNQVREFARKLSLGLSVDQALKSSDPSDTTTSKDASKKGPAPIRLTTEYLRGLKHDVNFLKQAKELEQVNSSYNKQLHKFDHSTDVRRKARRELKKLSKKEAEAERKREENEWKLLERHELEVANQDSKESGPTRSIRACAELLIKDFVFSFSDIKCPTTGRKVFPSDPKVLQQRYSKKSKKRPVRASCGCWFSVEELDKFLTEPPFGAACVNPGCNGAKVFHKDWPTDVKQLEKQWAMKQAREREIAEIADFMGAGAFSSQ